MNRTWTFASDPAGWYLACPSAAVARGRSRATRFATIVREGGGGLRAIERTSRGRDLAVAERYGVVLVYPGTDEPPSIPTLERFDRAVTTMGRPIRLRCEWPAVVANGFDVQHLGVVHRRALCEPPVIAQASPDRFRLEYVSRVTGATASDRAMRWLSGDRVRAAIECWSGTAVTVESRAGARSAALLLCLTPEAGTVTVTPVVAVPARGPSALAQARAWAARLLYGAFLARDVELLDGMRFRPVPVLPEDAALAECLDFLSGVRSLGDRSAEVATDVEHGRLDVAEPLAPLRTCN